MEARATPLVAVPKRRDGLSEELEAIATIGRVLDSITDPVVRQRVLRWALERFHDASIDASIPTSNSPTAIASPDPSLAVDSLGDIFQHARQAQDGLEVPGPADKAAEATLRSFVADFQRLAKDWEAI